MRPIPYLRSSYYFADLNAKIRAFSHGRRDLDRVLRELFVRRQRGERIDHAAWIALVERGAGPGAREDFEGIILRGDRTVIPAPDAFGARLTRREIRNPAGAVTGYEWVPR